MPHICSSNKKRKKVSALKIRLTYIKDIVIKPRLIQAFAIEMFMNILGLSSKMTSTICKKNRKPSQSIPYY